MNYIFFNKEIIPIDELKILSTNRAFKYGDGLFESLIVINQNPVFIEYNLKRLFKGMQLLEIEIPDNWNSDFFKTAISKLAKKNKSKHARCRITVWRAGEGLYKPETNNAELLIELFAHDTDIFELNAVGITAGVFDKFPKEINALSTCKTCNALVYVLAAKYAHDQHMGDVVLVNTQGKIADAVSSNVFIVKNNAAYTTMANNGGVEGTMQQVILDHVNDWDIKLERIDMRKEDILIADEFFLTNAIQGIKWVQHFGGKDYENDFSQKLMILLNQLLKRDNVAG